MEFLSLIIGVLVLATYVAQVRGIIILFGGHKKINKTLRIWVAVFQCLFSLVFILYCMK